MSLGEGQRLFYRPSHMPWYQVVSGWRKIPLCEPEKGSISLPSCVPTGLHRPGGAAFSSVHLEGVASSNWHKGTALLAFLLSLLYICNCLTHSQHLLEAVVIDSFA